LENTISSGCVRQADRHGTKDCRASLAQTVSGLSAPWAQELFIDERKVEALALVFSRTVVSCSRLVSAIQPTL
ncbi:MAG: hypothetical protein WCF85_22185, partial [Rhodospirillaceae bacterium]